MQILSTRATMAGAKQFVPDRGIDLRRGRRVEAVIALARRWNRDQANREARRRAMDEAIRRAAAREERRRRDAAALADRVAVKEDRRTPQAIIGMVAAWHGLRFDDIVGDSRVTRIVEARFDAIVAVYQNCRIGGELYSLNALGRIFRRDHTSAHNALQQRGVR